MVQLKNRKPDIALQTLRATRLSELPSEIRDQRLLLEARATSETGRHDLALELIEALQGKEVDRLRSDILWSAKRYGEAAEAIERAYGERWQGLRAARRQRAPGHPAGGGRLRARRRTSSASIASAAATPPR